MNSPEYVTSNQIRQRYGGRSHMWVEHQLKDDPAFPRPTYLGRLRYWKLSELEAWERKRACMSMEAASSVAVKEKPPCIDGDHPSYRDPLRIEWLCRPCHKDEHSRLKNGGST